MHIIKKEEKGSVINMVFGNLSFSTTFSSGHLNKDYLSCIIIGDRCIITEDILGMPSINEFGWSECREYVVDGWIGEGDGYLSSSLELAIMKYALNKGYSIEGYISKNNKAYVNVGLHEYSEFKLEPKKKRYHIINDVSQLEYIIKNKLTII